MRWKRPGREPSASPSGASRSAVGAEEDVDGTHLESLFCLRTQIVASRLSRRSSFSRRFFSGGNQQRHFFVLGAAAAWHFAPRLRSTRAWRPRVRRDRRIVTRLRVPADLAGANQSSSGRRRRSSRSTTPTPRSTRAPSVSATRHLDVRSNPPKTGASEVHRRSRARARACVFVAGTNSPTWARTSSRGRGGTRAHPGSAPRAPPTSATTRRKVEMKTKTEASRIRRAPRSYDARALCTRGSRFAT